MGQTDCWRTPFPFSSTRPTSPLGTLRAHVARANPQWRALPENPEALVIFQGSDHYVSPSWYATKRETGKVVPTWNYVMVQARGAARIIRRRRMAVAPDRGPDPSDGGRARAEPWAVVRRAGGFRRGAAQGDRRDRNRDRRHPGQMEDEPEPQRRRSRRRRRRPRGARRRRGARDGRDRRGDEARLSVRAACHVRP